MYCGWNDWAGIREDLKGTFRKGDVIRAGPRIKNTSFRIGYAGGGRNSRGGNGETNKSQRGAAPRCQQVRYFARTALVRRAAIFGQNVLSDAHTGSDGDNIARTMQRILRATSKGKRPARRVQPAIFAPATARPSRFLSRSSTCLLSSE